MSNKEKISGKVYEEIKKEEVKMKPRCFFAFKSLAWLTLAGMFFVLTVFLISASTTYIGNFQMGVMAAQKPGLFFGSLPYFLIGLTILFIYLAARSYRKSRRLCQHEEWMLLGVIVFGALVIGVVASYARLDRGVMSLLENQKGYDMIIVTSKEYWSQPEKGTLSGVVTAQASKKMFYLENWEGKNWIVFVVDKNPISKTQVKAQNTPGSFKIVRMVGEQKKPAEFAAWAVWKW